MSITLYPSFKIIVLFPNTSSSALAGAGSLVTSSNLLFAKNDGSVASYMIYRDDDTIAQMMGVEKESMTYYDFILNEETETDADTLELLPEDHEEITLETRIKSFLAAELGEELEEEDDSEENQEFDEEV